MEEMSSKDAGSRGGEVPHKEKGGCGQVGAGGLATIITSNKCKDKNICSILSHYKVCISKNATF